MEIEGSPIGVPYVLLPCADGGEIIISDDALAGYLSSLGHEVRVTIIDTCKSLHCAQRVAEVVDCAIGVGDDIYEDEAIRFYEIFYQAAGAGYRLHHQHKTSLRRCGTSERG